MSNLEDWEDLEMLHRRWMAKAKVALMAQCQDDDYRAKKLKELEGLEIHIRCFQEKLNCAPTILKGHTT